MGRERGLWQFSDLWRAWQKRGRDGVFEGRLIPQCTHTHTHTHTHIYKHIYIYIIYIHIYKIYKQIYIYIYIYIIYIYINIIECKNWGYEEQVQGVNWYVSYEAGFIFKASREALCAMLDKVCCTVVKP